MILLKTIALWKGNVITWMKKGHFHSHSGLVMLSMVIGCAKAIFTQVKQVIHKAGFSTWHLCIFEFLAKYPPLKLKTKSSKLYICDHF